MMRAALIACAAATLASAAAAAQVRVPPAIQRVLPGGRGQPPPPLVGIDALRADFVARSGSDLVYFIGDSPLLTPQARTTLAAQAMWLRQHPEIVVRIEGHGQLTNTRSHALGIGARRAHEVRDYLILLGVPAAQLSAVSLGKERPGPPRAVTVLVR